MNPQTAFILLMTLLAAASYGWGVLAIWVASGWRRAPGQRVHLDVPMNIAIGIALFLVLGGFAVAANAAYFAVLFAWLIAGAVITVISIVRRWRRRSGPAARRWSVLLAGVCALAATVLALAPFALARWSEADDAPAYTYLGQRLLATGGLIDPFNSRRLQNYGGAELIQSLVIKVAGTSAASAIETVFFCLLAVALLIRSLRRPYAVVIIVTVGIAVVIAQPVGNLSNTGPTFSETVLLVALARLFADNQRRGESQGWLFAIGGLLFAALFSLRPQGVPAALAVVLVAACLAPSTRLRLRSVVIAAFSAGVGLLGWAIALHRSSDAWVFGFAMPSWTQASWSTDPAITTLGQHLTFVRELTGVDYWSVGVLGATLLALVTTAVIYVCQRARHRPTSITAVAIDLRLDLIAALVGGNVGLLVVFSYMGDGDAMDSIGHYFSPIVLALALFTLDRVWEIAGNRTGMRLPAIPLAGVALTFIAYAYAFCDLPLTLLRHDLSSSASASLQILEGRPFAAGIGQQYQDDLNRPIYEKVNSRVPRNSYLLSAVEFPGLLDFHKFRFATLDEAYGNSPPPHLPETGNARATVRYLKHLGFTGILAESLSAPFYYNYADNYEYSHQSVLNYQNQDGALVKWDQTLLKIEQIYTTSRIGGLRYITFTPRSR